MKSIQKSIKDIINIYLADHWSVDDVWSDLTEEHPWLLEVDSTEHLIEVYEDKSWIIQHPISERIRGTLFSCPFNKDYSNYEPGKYEESLS